MIDKKYIPLLAWLVSISMAAVALFFGWRIFLRQQPMFTGMIPQNLNGRPVTGLALPTAVISPTEAILERVIAPLTYIPDRPTENVRLYTVEKGDSIFGIARNFRLKPESLLWANYDQLNDNPDLISLGMKLNILPIDGVYYQWQNGDTLEGVAEKFKVQASDILGWVGNQIDLANPVIEAGAWLVIPGGKREFRQWLIPVIPRGAAGVSKELYGAGACEGNYTGGAVGTGGFVWPTGNHTLSGNDYWSGHLGIDIAAGDGAEIHAADGGVVVFAGWSTGGYGNMVMIDHGNGYQTLYGHLSQVVTGCGRSVGKSQLIGYAGSTGNSTGAHLHFEVRYQGGFIDPWYVLPAP